MSRIKLIAAIGAVLVLVSVIFIVYIRVHPVGTPMVRYKVLVNGTIIVGANYAYSIEFSVPTSSSNILVQGDFALPNGNVIMVYVSDSNSLNPRSSSFHPYYNSGLATQGHISATLPSSGTYFLVFDNHNYDSNYSFDIDKNITTKVELTYYEF